MYIFKKKNIFSCSKYYDIKKKAQNILSQRLHTIYSIVLVCDILVFDQMKNSLLKSLHQQLGPESTFKLWILGTILDNLGEKLIHTEAFVICSIHVVWISIILFSINWFWNYHINSCDSVATRVEPGDLRQRHVAAAWVLRTGGQAVPRAAAPPPHGDHAQEDEAPAHLQPGNYAVVDSIKKKKEKKRWMRNCLWLWFWRS